MIEKIVIDYLSKKLNVPVFMGERPTRNLDEYIVIQTIDGGRRDLIDAVTFNIYSYSNTSLLNSAEINEQVKKAMFDIIELPEISASKCGGGGQNIDTTTKTYAYNCVFNLFYMED